jgi:hypothetical protein
MAKLFDDNGGDARPGLSVLDSSKESDPSEGGREEAADH